MKEIIEIVCDSEAEADFAEAWCRQNDLKNILRRSAEGIHLVELEGTPPYEFRGRFSKIASKVFIVSAEQ